MPLFIKLARKMKVYKGCKYSGKFLTLSLNLSGLIVHTYAFRIRNKQ
jgi:hypothetical protein